MSLCGSAAHWKLSKENSWVRFSFFCFLCFSTLFWHAKCWNIISVFRAVFPLLGRISVNSFSCCLLSVRLPCKKNNKNSHRERKNLWGITLWRGVPEWESERGTARGQCWIRGRRCNLANSLRCLCNMLWRVNGIVYNVNRTQHWVAS